MVCELKYHVGYTYIRMCDDARTRYMYTQHTRTRTYMYVYVDIYLKCFTHDDKELSHIT